MQVIQQLLAARRLLVLAGVSGEALNKRLQFLDLLLVLLVYILLLARHHLGVFIPEVVVADIHLDLAEVDVADVRTDLVEEVTVVADDDDRIREIQQEVFQPADGLDIQIVRRFVQQQDVRISKQRLRQQHLDLLAAVQLAHQLMLKVEADAQTRENRFRVALGAPAVQLGELALQLAGALAVRVGEILFGVKLVLFLHNLIEALVPHDDRLQHFIAVKLKVILAQDGHALAGGDDHFTRGRLQLAGEHLQESRFARSVCADDAVAVTGGEFNVDVLKERLSAVRKGNILGCDHVTRFSFFLLHIPKFTYIFYYRIKSAFLQALIPPNSGSRESRGTPAPPAETAS